MEDVSAYLRLYAHVARLVLRGIGSRWPWLFVAPAVYLVLRTIQTLVVRAFSGGIAGGILAAFLGSLALSLVLYVGRALLEQRRLDVDELRTGLVAFLGDVMTVFFLLWVASLVLGVVSPLLAALLFLAVWAMPTFEIVALTPVSGIGIFEAAFRFVRRDALAWFAGHLPLVALVPAWLALATLPGLVPVYSLPPALARFVLDLLSSLPWAVVFLAYLYRGVLYLTLDATPPRMRLERFRKKS